jgi:hypothetical protein
MSELIMPLESVIKILNLYHNIEYYLTYEERESIQAFIHGNPTDVQQKQVLYILQAIMESYPVDSMRKNDTQNVSL